VGVFIFLNGLVLRLTNAMEIYWTFIKINYFNNFLSHEYCISLAVMGNELIKMS
jgi:hypothetical protein